MTVSGGSLGKKVATETKHIYTYTNTYTPRKNFRKNIRSFFLKKLRHQDVSVFDEDRLMNLTLPRVNRFDRKTRMTRRRGSVERGRAEKEGGVAAV